MVKRMVEDTLNTLQGCRNRVLTTTSIFFRM